MVPCFRQKERDAKRSPILPSKLRNLLRVRVEAEFTMDARTNLDVGGGGTPVLEIITCLRGLEGRPVVGGGQRVPFVGTNNKIALPTVVKEKWRWDQCQKAAVRGQRGYGGGVGMVAG